MNKNSNKLISLLVTFDRHQFKQCSKFLASPYFNRSVDLQHFFSELSRRIEKDISLKKETVWKSVWGKRPYDDVRFRKYSSDLLKLIEQFTIQEELHNSPMVSKRLWISAINRLKAQKQTEGILRNWDKEISNLKGSLSENADKYLTLFQLEQLKFELARFDSRTQNRSNLEEIMYNLDTFYITEKLYAHNSANSTAFSRNFNYKIELIEPIIEYLKSNPRLLDQPAIAAQYYNYLIELEPEEVSHYFNFKNILLTSGSLFSENDLYILYQTALNYSTRKLNKGHTSFLKEYIDVYKHGLKGEAVFENGRLDPIQFKTTVLCALRNKQFDWAESYIKTYQHRIPEQYRENAVNLNMATFYFYQKDYDKAMDYLRDVEYENVTYNLNAKSMLLAIYYETDEFDALDSFFDAFQAYLTRHKEIPPNYKALFRNLMSITRKMTRVIPGDKKAVEKLKKEVEETKAIASLNWVREKLDELA